MNPNDEITALALDYLKSKDTIAEKVRDAFSDLPRAPLAQLIEEFLAMQPRFDLAPLLMAIGETNQGRIEDLNLPIFQSYLLAKCGVNEMQLHRAIKALNNFLVIKASSAQGNRTMMIAARDEENSGSKSATTADLLEQVKKRVK